MMIFMTLALFALMAYLAFIIIDRRRERLEYGDDEKKKRFSDRALWILFLDIFLDENNNNNN